MLSSKHVNCFVHYGDGQFHPVGHSREGEFSHEKHMFHDEVYDKGEVKSCFCQGFGRLGDFLEER